MVERLWVPLSQVLLARNWNVARSGLALTTSSVAKRAWVSTPLRTGSTVELTVMVVPPGGWGVESRGRSRRDEVPRRRPGVDGRQGGQPLGLRVECLGELSLEGDEGGRGGEPGEGVGELEDIA